MNKIINWIKENKILTTIITGVIIEIVASTIISITKEIDFLKATKIFWNTLISFFGKILNFKIPIWSILVVGLLLYIILLIIIKIEESKTTSKTWYEDYTKDNYKSVLYCWNYYKTFDGKIDLKDFRPICNLCNGDLTITNSYRNSHYMTPQLYCPNCDKVLKTPSSEEIEQAELFVRNNLKKRYENEIKNKKN